MSFSFSTLMKEFLKSTKHRLEFGVSKIKVILRCGCRQGSCGQAFFLFHHSSSTSLFVHFSTSLSLADFPGSYKPYLEDNFQPSGVSFGRLVHFPR